MKELYCQKPSVISRLLPIVLCLLSVNLAMGQSIQQQNIPFFDENNNQLDLALLGGLNNPQFSEVDWNNDGIQDLFIFDKDGNMPMALLNKGAANQVDYHFTAEYISDFPPIESWAMMRDYNCDGIMDLFAHSRIPAGIRVYRGYHDSDAVKFTLVEDFIEFPTLNNFLVNLFVTSEDYPAIDDIDNDGDLDVLTFGVSGGWVSYYENQSQEMGYGCDSLIFELVDNCWGRFFESGLSCPLDLSPKKDSCVGLDTFIGQPQAPDAGIHVGSTLLTLDMDADNDKELLLGDISFTCATMGYNTGTADTAWITSQDAMFPSDDMPIDVTIFPATFHLDVNNDGAKDLLVSPNRINTSENYATVWLYENSGASNMPDFNYQTKTFLVDEIVDLGSGTSPEFFDHNGDGLLDLVVGTFGFRVEGGNYEASIFLYENIGTLDLPEYKLVNTNYTNLPENHNLRAIDLTFGDLDGDGDKDMIFGEEFGKLFYYENVDNGDGIANFQNFDTLDGNYNDGDNTVGQIDIGQHATPFLVDIDRDGLLDLIIGEKNGNLNYWKNTGTTSEPLFLKMDDFFGSIDCREFGFPEGFCDVTVKEIDGEYVLFTGSEPGNIRRYIHIEDSLAAGAPFLQADSLFGNIVQGRRSRIAADDINGDGEFDFFIGNQRGGLALYSDGEITVSNTVPDTPDFTFNLYPNPTSNLLNINYIHTENTLADLTIFDVLGKNIYQEKIQENIQLNIANLSNGIYFCKVQIGGQFEVQKFIKR